MVGMSYGSVFLALFTVEQAYMMRRVRQQRHHLLYIISINTSSNESMLFLVLLLTPSKRASAYYSGFGLFLACIYVVLEIISYYNQAGALALAYISARRVECVFITISQILIRFRFYEL